MRMRMGALLVVLSGAWMGTGCTALTLFDGYSSGPGTDAGLDAATVGDGGDRDAGTDGDGGVTTCDPDCGDSGECVDGTCMCGAGSACGAGTACCADACVNTEVNVEHCGTCGFECPSGPRSNTDCVSGGCTIECEGGFGDCDDTPGCETDLSDPDTCGSCDNPCDPTQLCDAVNGVCVDECDPGLIECDGACVDANSSVLHCLGCGNACDTPFSATPSCDPGLGGCAYSCTGGREDCNMDLGAPGSDGCEEIPSLFYEDFDDDGWGTPDNSEALCAAEAATRGWVAMSGDCQDMDPAINPGATELCDGINQNCNADIDEGFGVGDACGCPGQPGIGGTVQCFTVGDTYCEFPGEVCNGLDDNCDGTPDNGSGMVCALGSVDSCDFGGGTIPGCTAPSEWACNASCTGYAPNCPEPPETCNGADDNCNDFVDEGRLAPSSPTVDVGNYDNSSSPIEPRIAWDASSGRGAVFWGTYTSLFGRYILRMREIDATGGPIGGATNVANINSPSGAPPGSLALGWDGAAWVMVWLEDARVRWARISAGVTLTPAEDFPSGGVSANASSVSIAQADGELALLWNDQGVNPRLYLRKIRSGVDVGGGSLALSYARPHPVGVGTPEGTYMVFYNSAASLIRWTELDGFVQVSGGTLVTGGVEEVPIQVVFEPTRNQALLVYQQITGAGRAMYASVDRASAVAIAGVDIGPQQPMIGLAADGRAMTATYSTEGPVRVRTSDGALYPEAIPLLTNTPYDLTGVPAAGGGGGHYLAVGAVPGAGSPPMGGDIHTQVIRCF